MAARVGSKAKAQSVTLVLPPLAESALQGKQGQRITTLFHVTPEGNLAKILKEGLLPGRSASSLQAVFLSDDRGTAENYECMKDEPCVLLEIEARFIHPEHLLPDNYELQDWLDGLSDEDRDELVGGATTWNDLIGEQSLHCCCQAAYALPIPPEAIRASLK